MNALHRACVSAVAGLGLVGVWTPAGAAMSVGGNFWNISWEGTSDFFRGGINWATVTDPWNPALLTDCEPYTTLRFMDWCLPRLNDNTGVWSQRTQKTESQDMSGGRAVAYEWMIDLSNRTDKDMWITVPTRADTNYSYQLALLINSLLEPQLKVYVEYTNEHWNYDASWYNQQGAAMGFPGDATMQGDFYYTYRAVQVWRQFERVFGQNSPRIVKFLGAFATNNSIAGHMFAALNDTIKVNPTKVKADAIGIAPYMRGGDVAACLAELPNKYQEAANHMTLANRGGVQLMCYEAGFETASGSAIASDPAVYGLVRSYLDTLMAAGVTVCNWYTAVGGTSGYQWGAKRTTGESPTTAHKYRAIYDWMAAHPVAVDVTRGVTVAALRPRAVLRGTSVEVRLDGAQDGSVSLFGMDGGLLHRSGFVSGAATLPVSGCAAGCYLVRTTSGSTTQAQPVLIR